MDDFDSGDSLPPMTLLPPLLEAYFVAQERLDEATGDGFHKEDRDPAAAYQLVEKEKEHVRRCFLPVLKFAKVHGIDVAPLLRLMRVMDGWGELTETIRNEAIEVASAIELTWIMDQESRLEADAAHSPGFRSVRWFGTVYSFTGNQAAIVEVLWAAWQQGTPDVGAEELLEAADSSQDRVDLVFRDCPAWGEGKMIVPGATKGSYRLRPPPKKKTRGAKKR